MENPTKNKLIINIPGNGLYPVMESFYTLQGEGFHTGRAAYFIRLAGCDVGCVWCDVKESWETTGYPVLSAAEITQKAVQFPGRFAVITGGEPSLHNLEDLIKKLKINNFTTAIETSGTNEIKGDPDWVCLSPKKFKAPLIENLTRANELKSVVYSKSDLDWIEQFVPLVSADCRLFLQPEWSKRDGITPLIIDYIKNHPEWQLSLQTHKYTGIP